MENTIMSQVAIITERCIKIRIMIARWGNDYFYNIWVNGKRDGKVQVLTVEEARATFDLYCGYSIFGRGSVYFECQEINERGRIVGQPTQFSWEAEWLVDGDGNIVNEAAK
jgi:hypothetical protein